MPLARGHRYDFNLTPFGNNFYDYPKIGSWPDAYYMADNVFNAAGTAYLGTEPFAFDRNKMLCGNSQPPSSVRAWSVSCD